MNSAIDRWLRLVVVTPDMHRGTIRSFRARRTAISDSAFRGGTAFAVRIALNRSWARGDGHRAEGIPGSANLTLSKLLIQPSAGSPKSL